MEDISQNAYLCLEIGESIVKFDAIIYRSSLILSNLKDLVLLEKDLRILMKQNIIPINDIICNN